MTQTFISNWEVCFTKVLGLLSANEPFFLARIGGSDTEAVMDYIKERDSGPQMGTPHFARTLSHLRLVKRFNGYYDKVESKSKFVSYCEEMENSYLECDNLVIGGNKLLSAFLPANIDPKFRVEVDESRSAYEALFARIESTHGNVNFYPYPFIEKLVQNKMTLFAAFSETLKNARVLVVSPFSQSIKDNFSNKERFFKNYSYPDFELLLYNTPITYSGLPDHLYPHCDWHETSDAIKSDISALEFDIALLACGSYAMPLGVHISKALKKQAIYVGGVLQMYFGIMGRRYENSFFLDQINREAFIYPIESVDYMAHITIKSDTAREAFGAYF